MMGVTFYYYMNQSSDENGTHLKCTVIKNKVGNRTNLNETVQWTVSATSSGTGCYNNFYFLQREVKMQIDSPSAFNRIVSIVSNKYIVKTPLRPPPVVSMVFFLLILYL